MTFDFRKRIARSMPWHIAVYVPVLAIIVWLSPAAQSAVDAQMFGARQMGRTLRRQTPPGLTGDVGTLRNQRFIRGNRQRADFVGADRVEAREFVGMEQAGGGAATARSAVSGVAAARDQSSQINQPARRSPAGRPYDPRLAIAFDYPDPASVQLVERLSLQLSALWPSIEVSVAGRTARLRGTVASAQDRQLAEVLIGLEPGVSRVQNELQVASDRSVVPPPPPPAD